MLCTSEQIKKVRLQNHDQKTGDEIKARPHADCIVVISAAAQV